MKVEMKNTSSKAVKWFLESTYYAYRVSPGTGLMQKQNNS